MLDRETDQLLATPPFDLIHPDDLVRSHEALERLAKGEASGFRHRLRHSDGSYRWISWNASVVDDRIYAVGRDVTNEERLQQLAVEKEAAEAATARANPRHRRPSSSAHPLTTILGLGRPG